MERRLYRSDTEKMLFGVAGGVAEYFNVDPTLVRVGFAVAALLNGAGIILYLALAIIMPRKSSSPPDTGSGTGTGTTPSTGATPSSEAAPSSPPPPEAPTSPPPAEPPPPQREDEGPRTP